jgi:endonuclease III related protein
MMLLERFYRRLLTRFGPQHWWPGRTRWEIAAGAVLTQNTNWRNVERAIARLRTARALTAATTASLSAAELAELIRPAGCFNVKAVRLQALAAWWVKGHRWAARPSTPTKVLRDSLLAVRGIGPETADSIALYAFGRPVFVIDAYTRRVLTRHGLAATTATYAGIQAQFEATLPCEARLFNEYHALLVRLGKDFCRPTPRCASCPLAQHPHQSRPPA